MTKEVAMSDSASQLARGINILAGIWLFISAFALPHVSNAPVWNNAIVAVIIFVISLIPQGRPAMGTARDRAQQADRSIPPPQHPQAVWSVQGVERKARKACLGGIGQTRPV